MSQPASSGRGLNPQTAGSTSTNLLVRLKARDPEAWRRLVSLYGPVVYGWCRQCGLQQEDASDVMQEVFRAVSGHVAHFRRENVGDTFRGWLWTITRNKVRDHFRAMANRPVAMGGTDAKQRFSQVPQCDSVSEEEPGALDVDRLVVHRALQLIRNDFNESTWQAFWRMTIQGHSAAEVAEDLGMRSGAVRQAKCRVLQRLREELEGVV